MDDDLDPVVTDRFAAFDDLPAPDLTDRIFGVAAAPASAAAVVDGRMRAVARAGALEVRPTARLRRRPSRLVTSLAVAAALFGGGLPIGLLVGRDSGSDGPTTLMPTPATTQPTTAASQPAQPPPLITGPLPSIALPYGAATVTPSTVAVGQELTVQPAAEIEPICTNLASVHVQGSDGLIQIGSLAPDGRWFGPIDVNGESIHPVPGCLAQRSTDPMAYVVPTELAAGRYVICISSSVSEAGCGTITVDAPRVTDPVTLALEQLGADVNGSPTGVLGLDEATWCGAEQRWGPDPDGLQIDESARRCLIDAHLAAAPAVFVRLFTSTEGDPIVEVWRTLADGSIQLFTDMTRDTQSASRRWETQSCGRLTTEFPGPGVVPTTFGCAEDAAPPVAPASESMPDWFTSRPVLPLCGYAIRLVDVDKPQRDCFGQAIEGRRPAEFAHVDLSGGERAARWFRVTSTGDFEVYEQTIVDGAPAVWQRYACARLDVLYGVEPEWYNVPFFDPAQCAVGVDAEPPATATTVPEAATPTAPPGTILADTTGQAPPTTST